MTATPNAGGFATTLHRPRPVANAPPHRGNGNLQAMPAPTPETETRHEKFRRLMAARVSHILNMYRLLENLQSHNYDYTDADIDQVRQVLATGLELALAGFRRKDKILKFQFHD